MEGMLLCPKCQRPMGPNHNCAEVPAQVAYDALQDTLGKIISVVRDLGEKQKNTDSYLANINARLEKVERKTNKKSKRKGL